MSLSLIIQVIEDGNLFIAAKAFAAGVILATGFVHMLPDGSKNLSSSCLPKNPWSKFPFSRFIAMMAALLTFMLDFVETQLYERKAEKMRRKEGGHNDELGLDGSLDCASAAGILPADRSAQRGARDVVCSGVGEESIVRMRAHGHGHDAGDGHVVDVYGDGHLLHVACYYQLLCTVICCTLLFASARCCLLLCDVRSHVFLALAKTSMTTK